MEKNTWETKACFADNIKTGPEETGYKIVK
jgi:hypothetical protein